MAPTRQHVHWDGKIWGRNPQFAAMQPNAKLPCYNYSNDERNLVTGGINGNWGFQTPNLPFLWGTGAPV